MKYFNKNRRIVSSSMIFLLMTGCKHNKKKSSKFFSQEKPLSVLKPSFSEQKKIPVIYAIPKELQVLVTCHCSGAMSIFEVLKTLAAAHGVNWFLDPLLYGKINDPTGIEYHVSQVSLFHILDQLVDMGLIRFYWKNNTLHILPPHRYVMTYDVQFLLGTRKSKNQTTVVSEGMSAAVTPINGKNTELSGFSNTVLSSETDPDFWKELQDNLHMMLKESGIPEYSIHKYGGLLTVRATQKEHRQLRSYVQNLKKKVMSQVLIEAKIVEVELKREYSQGIEWGVLLHTAQAKLGFNQDFIASSAAAPRFVFNAMQEDGRGLNIQSFLKLLQNFGRLHTISNPRITVLNNQTAILKIATNEVFFSQIKDRIYNKNLSSPMEEMSTKIHTIPVGLLLMVHPSIDTDGSIVLSFRPTIANVTSYVTNPGFEGQKSQVPVIRLRVMDSVMRLQSGEVMAAGGLIEEEYRGRNERGLQALNHEKKSVKRELVIFVKVQQLENYPLHSFPPEWLNPED